jgi:cytoskeletal protein CcmA (bactofilin family)
LNVTGITTVSNHILPADNVSYDLGSSTNRFRDLYLSGGTIDLAGGTISFDGTSFNFQGGTNVGQSVETESTVFDLLNNIAQTINFGGDATTVNIGALSGSTNVRNNLAVAGQITVGSSDSSVSTLAVTDTTFFLADTTAETIYFGGAATSINMGSLGGLTTVATDLTVTGDVILDSDLTVNGNLTLTSLNTSGENNDFVISPQGTGRVIIEPQGGFILNPSTLGNINNVNIGATTRASGRFTSLEANAQTRFTAGISSVDSTTGTVVVQGGMGVGENLNVEGNVSANQLTLRGTVLFENELSVSSGGTGAGQFNARGILYGNSTDAIQSTAGSDYETPYTGTNQQTSNAILTTTAQGVPVWTDVIDCGTF